jgi:hypothetical protein
MLASHAMPLAIPPATTTPVCPSRLIGARKIAHGGGYMNGNFFVISG